LSAKIQVAIPVDITEKFGFAGALSLSRCPSVSAATIRFDDHNPLGDVHAHITSKQAPGEPSD
jgi:hypothetical protein